MQEYKKTALTVLALIFLIVFLGLAFTSDNAKATKETSAPDNETRCSSCHEMTPEVLTWEVSSHSKIACTACHKIDPTDFKAKHDSGSFDQPISVSEAIPNSVCEQCHSQNRLTTPSGDLIVPHDRHEANGVACVKCHSGIAHANIAERGLTNDKTVKWTPEYAKKISTRYYTAPNMWVCINCHKAAGVTRRCGACHTTIPELPSHNDPTWKSSHGKTARVNIGECTKCHVTPASPTFVNPSTGDKAADFARAQNFCYSCHTKRPEFHSSSMLPIHPGIVAQRGIQNCLTCHNANQPKPGESVTGTYCNQCHWLQQNGQKQVSSNS